MVGGDQPVRVDQRQLGHLASTGAAHSGESGKSAETRSLTICRQSIAGGPPAGVLLVCGLPDCPGSLRAH